MHKFTCAADIGDLHIAVAEALEIKRDRYQFTGLYPNIRAPGKSSCSR